MIIKTSDINSIKPFINNLKLPQPNSHKGQNGKVLIIGGSSLFHAASLWAAETASYFVDIVHYSSTVENEKVFLSLKKKFINGIIVPQKDLYHYVEEDEAILVGPGMMRDGMEGRYAHDLTKSLIEKFPQKKFVFDAGSLQMMEKDWLLKLKQKALITPHQIEFEGLFDIPISKKSREEKIAVVKATAKKYRTIILLKAISDIISDGEKVYVVEGGNPGLTKGGTGDVLAGIALSLYAKNKGLTAAVVASYLLKSAGESLYQEKGYWYNVSDIIQIMPSIFKKLVLG